MAYLDLAEGDPLRPLQKFCETVTYCKTLGMYAYSVEGLKVGLAMPWSEQILGDAERQLAHTGAVTTLIDSACGMAVLHRLRKPEAIATLDLRMDFLRPAPAGHIILCIAWCHRLTRNVAFVQAEACVEGLDEPIATASGSFMLLRPGQGSEKSQHEAPA